MKLYANVNRGLPSLSTRAMVKAAEQALDAGFDTIKCAPFVGVRPHRATEPLLRHAFERIDGIRRSIGEATLLVDAHGRLDAKTGAIVSRQLHQMGIRWLEEPVRFQDDPETLAAVAAAAPVPIAAGELLPDVASYQRLLCHGATSIVMTDVKHNGGVAATRQIAALCQGAKRPLSLHNPSGPVSTLTSAHISLAIGQTAPMEYFTHQERSKKCVQMFGREEGVSGGRLVVEDSPGLGVDVGVRAFDFCRVGATSLPI